MTTASATSPSGEPDSDGDHLPDAEELQVGSNPQNPDSDGDGISDADEVMVTGTGPFSIDTNGNGVTDYNEFYGNTTVNVNVSGPGVTPYDYDGDGITDPNDPNPFDPHDNEPDSDYDYVPNSEDSDPGNPMLWNDWNRNGIMRCSNFLDQGQTETQDARNHEQESLSTLHPGVQRQGRRPA